MGREFDIDVTGDEQILAILNKLKNPYFLTPAMGRIGARLRTAMAKYPPPPPNSTYRRTMKLGRSWTHRIQTSLVQIDLVVGNNTPYGPDVQGEGTQAKIHKGRWQTDALVLQQSADFIGEEMEEEIEKVIRS